MWFTKDDDGFRGWLPIAKGAALQTGLAGSVTVTVVDPDDDASTSPTVSESTELGGLYTFLIPSSFFATNGLGSYSVVAVVNGGGVKDVRGEVLRVFDKDFDNSGTAIGDIQDTVVSAVEYQRGHHTAETYLYVDPVNGNDSNDGLTRGAPKLTIGSAVAAITQEHTAVIVLGNPTGQQVISENITLATPFTFLRGPGFDVQLAGNTLGVPTVSITATGCEVSGFEVTTPVTGTQDAISATADFALLRRLRVVNAKQDGMTVSGGSRLRVEECIVEGAGRYGVHVLNTSFAFIGANTIITGSGSDNLRIQPGAGAADDTVIRGITTTAAGGYGILVGAGSNRTRISDVAFVANTSGDLQDDGTDTIFDAGHLTAQEARDAMKLAPTAGAPAAGSIDADLDTLTSLVDVAVSTRAAPGDAMALTAAERDAAAAALLDLASGVESGKTVREFFRALAALHLGESTGGPAQVSADAFGNPGTPRVIANSDPSGNHTSFTFTL